MKKEDEAGGVILSFINFKRCEGKENMTGRQRDNPLSSISFSNTTAASIATPAPPLQPLSFILIPLILFLLPQLVSLSSLLL